MPHKALDELLASVLTFEERVWFPCRVIFPFHSVADIAEVLDVSIRTAQRKLAAALGKVERELDIVDCRQKLAPTNNMVHRIG
jgi:hypothetical protein